MSSRNGYLSAEERRDARRLYLALLEAKKRIEEGERESRSIISAMERTLAAATIRIDYVSIVGYRDLRPLDTLDEKAVVAVAAFVGKTRLIDNLIVEITDDGTRISI